jgi:hypothetical protein
VLVAVGCCGVDWKWGSVSLVGLGSSWRLRVTGRWRGPAVPVGFVVVDVELPETTNCCRLRPLSPCPKAAVAADFRGKSSGASMTELYDKLSVARPKALAGFKVQFAGGGDNNNLVWARYTLECASCGDSIFRIQEISGECGPFGVAGVCENCGHDVAIFDATCDGYDGSLAHLMFMAIGRSQSPLLDKSSQPVMPGRLLAEISFSVPQNEVLEFAAEKGAAPHDLFDWFNIYVSPVGHDDWKSVWDFECA